MVHPVNLDLLDHPDLLVKVQAMMLLPLLPFWEAETLKVQIHLAVINL